MKKLSIYPLIILLLILSGCEFGLASSVSTPTLTPTPEKKRPTPTITPTNTPEVEPTSLPELPSPFDMDLAFTNNSCGYDDAVYSYTFTIDGASLSLLQTGAGITTTGSYDASSGAFSTTGAVGPGVESYEGMIAFDGTTITVTGTATYEQSGQCNSVNDIFGETTVP